jgi:glycosyltransferase involved in cell wall biosynthesis
MRIAFMGTMGIPARYGGAETCVEEIATRLARKGHEITVYCGYRDSKLRKRSYKGVQLIHIPSLGNKFMDFPFRLFISIFDGLNKDFDIIHFYGSDSGPFALVGRLTSKTVISLDGLTWNRSSYPILVRRILRLTSKFALLFPNAVTVDSKVVQFWYRKNFGESPKFIPYGANIDLTDPDETILRKYKLRNKKYIIFTGRLVHEKGVHYLVEAFARITTDFKLVIIGSDPFGKKYELFLKENANKNTVFLGCVYGKDYEELCKGAYIYVTPSNLEGTSPALLTAMALGKILLVSDIPENLETVGDSGFSFRHGDVEDLKQKLQFLIASPFVITEMQKKAVERIRNYYNWDKIADEVEKLYFSLLYK